ncbi:hypothetical protein EV697_10540 [Bisgaardia hudsonensis]|uniref:Nuclease-like protein n=1 Tax=Bisgaardia hudsonensis TaxID=109472 RepID=A0A4R2MYP3_9PAST|nr:hypothetical protein [Bisgaardia hudsonensis]TCP11928.1 hypothetical protein EV697_10540 [Bisgaardia hudsonensis]
MCNSEYLYKKIEEKHTGCIESIQLISKADNEPSFINSDIKILNFDRLAKNIGSSVRSPDGLYYLDNKFLFIEFKDQKSSSLNMDDKCRKKNIDKGMKGKLYEGISVFSSLLDNTISDLNIKYLVICNPAKNLQKNPVERTMQKAINKSTNNDEDNTRNKHHIDILKKYFHPLKKLNIKIEIDFIVSEVKLQNFLNSLNPKS